MSILDDQDELDEFVDSIKRDPDNHSIAGWIEALHIFAKYAKNGIKEKYFCGGEHDEIYFYFELDDLPPDTEDGKRLIALGIYPNIYSGNWYINT